MLEEFYRGGNAPSLLRTPQTERRQQSSQMTRSLYQPKNVNLF